MNMNDIETITLSFTIIANEVSNEKYFSLKMIQIEYLEKNSMLLNKIKCSGKTTSWLLCNKRRSSPDPLTFDKWSLVAQKNILRLVIMMPYGKILLGSNGHPYGNGTFFVIEHWKMENNWRPFYYIYLQNPLFHHFPICN